MEKNKILVAGGYGVVGSHISSLLSKNDTFIPVIAGRDEEKAKALARKLNCDWTGIDLENERSMKEALKNVNIVVSCYIPDSGFNTILPELAAENGVHYLDIAAFNGFSDRVTRLNPKAVENNATLITALGLYPGAPGLILAGSNDYFDTIDSIDIYFTSGGKMDKLSPLSLQGVNFMMNETPRRWNGEQWVETGSMGVKEHISEPFNKRISFYPFMITHDLLKIPEIVTCNKMVMWSGTESLFQGLIFFLGMKMGFEKNIRGVETFIKVLRFLGRNKNENYSLKIVTKGVKDNNDLERIVEMNAPEEALTAIVPVIVAEQIARGDIAEPGAFTGPEVVDARKFLDSLKEKNIEFKESLKKDEK